MMPNEGQRLEQLMELIRRELAPLATGNGKGPGLDQVLPDVRHALVNAILQLHGLPPMAPVTPEIRAMALEDLDEEEIAEELRELRAGPRQSLSDLIAELEQGMHDDEPHA
jgi:hypothetical protein